MNKTIVTVGIKNFPFVEGYDIKGFPNTLKAGEYLSKNTPEFLFCNLHAPILKENIENNSVHFIKNNASKFTQCFVVGASDAGYYASEGLEYIYAPVTEAKLVKALSLKK